MTHLVEQENQASEVFNKTIEYFKAEGKRHQQRAQKESSAAQVCEEIVERLINTCYVCGDIIANWGKKTVQEHIEESHKITQDSN
jgi:hypothetical protein